MTKTTGNGRKWWWLGIGLSIAIVVSTAIGGYAVLRADVQRHEKDIEANEVRSLTNREDLIEMKADLKYIRQAVDDLRKD